MRLKYFLRGIGIGIIVTTIILTISHISNRKMTDNEIIDRALELGMSFSGTQQETTTESASETGSDKTAESTDDKTAVENTTEAAAAETIQESTAEVPSEETTQEPVLEQTTAVQTTAAVSTETLSVEVVSCSIEIVPGMSSRTVCDMLKQNGIIEDAADFDRYLVNTGYDDKIRAGEILVNSGMTYEELTSVLYKK